MNDKPEKPKELIHLGSWKGDMTKCIKDTMKTIQLFIKEHKMKKTCTGNDILITFLTSATNIKFICEKLNVPYIGKDGNTLALSNTTNNQVSQINEGDGIDETLKEMAGF